MSNMGSIEGKKTVRVYPCPCCGCKDLWVGVMSASSYGVKCRCGLQLVRSVPDKWPKGVWKKSDGVDANLERLHLWVLNQSVEVWNKRVPEGMCRYMVNIEPNL